MVFNLIFIFFSYSTNAKSIGKIFRDQQNSALDTAVYWSEYVIRHKGAIHMKSPAPSLSIISYYSLDSIAILALIVLSAIYIPFKLISILIKKCSKNNSNSVNSSKGFKKKNTRSKKND